MNNKLLEA